MCWLTVAGKHPEEDIWTHCTYIIDGNYFIVGVPKSDPNGRTPEYDMATVPAKPLYIGVLSPSCRVLLLGLNIKGSNKR
jgi:hypothetical protein